MAGVANQMPSALVGVVCADKRTAGLRRRLVEEGEVGASLLHLRTTGVANLLHQLNHQDVAKMAKHARSGGPDVRRTHLAANLAQAWYAV